MVGKVNLGEIFCAKRITRLKSLEFELVLKDVVGHEN